MNKNTSEDSWGQLLSDFGIEDETSASPEPAPFEQARTRSAAPPDEQPDNFGAGLVEPETADADTPKDKKSIFSRFPKINFFGAPPEVSLDSVIEGTKSPTLGGKTFTDNTLEEMPGSQERKDRKSQKQRRQADASGGSSTKPDAWSAVASQIGALAAGEEIASQERSGEARTQPGERSRRRIAESMFDDPIPESEEARALKHLMGEQSHSPAPHSSSRHGRGRRKPEDIGLPNTELSTREQDVRAERGRGTRYRAPVEVDDLPESDFEMMDDSPDDMRPSASSGRGRRGSQYDDGDYRDTRQRDTRQRDTGQRGQARYQEGFHEEEWSEIDAALQAENRPPERREPADRGGRRQRYDRRSDIDRESLDSAGAVDAGVIGAYGGDTSSWDDAIGDIISSNLARRGAHTGSSHSGRGGSRPGRGRR